MKKNYDDDNDDDNNNDQWHKLVIKKKDIYSNAKSQSKLIISVNYS